MQRWSLAVALITLCDYAFMPAHADAHRTVLAMPTDCISAIMNNDPVLMHVLAGARLVMFRTSKRRQAHYFHSDIYSTSHKNTRSDSGGWGSGCPTVARTDMHPHGHFPI